MRVIVAGAWASGVLVFFLKHSNCKFGADAEGQNRTIKTFMDPSKYPSSKRYSSQAQLTSGKIQGQSRHQLRTPIINNI